MHANKQQVNKHSFFYEPAELHKISLRALKRRRFNVFESDENNGIIRAKTFNLLKPKIYLELNIEPITEQLTTLTINLKTKNPSKMNDQYARSIEDDFINTLYKSFLV